MKPAPFRYYRAGSLPQALELLNGAAEGGKLLAGGQSLVPLMNLRLARPEALIDLNPIRELSYIRSENGEIAIGALTRHREMEFSALIARELPVLGAVMPQIGHPAIRNRGTLGGSLAHADPAAELPCVLTALDAKLIMVGSSGERVARAEDFFIGTYTTTLSDHEILKEARIPLTEANAGWSFLEFSRRHGDFALAETAVLLFTKDGRASARVVVGGSVDRPLRVRSVETLLENELARNSNSIENLLPEIERLTVSEVQNSEAAREDSEYLRNLTGVLARRAVKEAVDRWSQP
ncbi:MAG TPA: xanthine dehydrogenase family protein subunit M [Candidatus Binatia bacterium]|nr:xanthine dehydrogenase family protein subunit M [Candidatus Binatia bacterium]